MCNFELFFFQVYAGKVISHLSYLADENIEDLKILQTVIVLLTTSNVVQQDSLAKVPYQPAVFLTHNTILPLEQGLTGTKRHTGHSMTQQIFQENHGPSISQSRTSIHIMYIIEFVRVCM